MSLSTPPPSTPEPAASGEKSRSVADVSALLAALVAMVVSAASATYEHKLDADQRKLETVGDVYNTYLAEIGNVEAQAEAADTSEVDLSASKKALDAIAVYGSGDAALAAYSTYNALRTATSSDDLNSSYWQDYRAEKERYVNELRDDLGVEASWHQATRSENPGPAPPSLRTRQMLAPAVGQH